MTVANTGNYSFDLSSLDDNVRKRYLVVAQRGKVILDSEISEIAFSAFTQLRNYMRINIGDGAIGDSFKIVESTINNVDNFKITGGASVDEPAMMFIKGIPALITGDIEYNAQKGHLDFGVGPISSANSDYFTESNLPGLIPPVSNRTDIVYMDLYFAEVSSEVGSEYQDTTIKNPIIGIQTANRFRIVQDIRVAEGGIIPVDGVDGNGIYHRYIQLATINRIGGNPQITNAMITDNRSVMISIKSLSDGTANLFVASLTATDINATGDINMQGNLIPNAAGTSNLGDATHRFANLFMSSNIDSLGGLTVNHSGATGDALKITRTGTSTGNLFNVNDLLTVDNAGDVLISESLVITGDLTVNGTTTTVNSDNLAVTDKNITINKNGNDVTSEGSGLTIERTGTFGSLIYKDTAAGKFAIGSLGSETDIVVSNRSIGVSGNGLSGGGDLSADRTITSNATSSNTPNTIVYRDASGNFSAGTITASFPTGSVPLASLPQMSANSLLGRSTAGLGDVEVISVGNGLLLSGGTLTAAGTGSVTTVSVVSANGVSGTVSNPTSAPAITISLGDITPNSITLGNSGAEVGPYQIKVLASSNTTLPASDGYYPASALGDGRDMILTAGDAYLISQTNAPPQSGGNLFVRGGKGYLQTGGTIGGNFGGTGDIRIADLGGDVYIGNGDGTNGSSAVKQGATYIYNELYLYGDSGLVHQDRYIRASYNSLEFSDAGNSNTWQLSSDITTNTFSILGPSVTSNLIVGVNGLNIGDQSGIADTSIALSTSAWRMGYHHSTTSFKISKGTFGTNDFLIINDVGTTFLTGNTAITGAAADLGSLVVGTIGSQQLQIADDKIQSMFGGVTSTLSLNYYGGSVEIGGANPANLHVTGDLTVDGAIPGITYGTFPVEIFVSGSGPQAFGTCFWQKVKNFITLSIPSMTPPSLGGVHNIYIKSSSGPFPGFTDMEDTLNNSFFMRIENNSVYSIGRAAFISSPGNRTMQIVTENGAPGGDPNFVGDVSFGSMNITYRLLNP